HRHGHRGQRRRLRARPRSEVGLEENFMRSRRAAFTLVEMMVAMTLTVFVMVILSQCFVQGLETFSGLKAIGDMQEELRTTTNLLRADLSADHFEGKRRLSDPWANLTSEKIREGFFAMGQ